MVQMTAANNIYRTLKRFRGLVGKMIHSLSQDERRMLRALRDGGLIEWPKSRSSSAPSIR